MWIPQSSCRKRVKVRRVGSDPVDVVQPRLEVGSAKEIEPS
jgi:hypothetical protein